MCRSGKKEHRGEEAALYNPHRPTRDRPSTGQTPGLDLWSQHTRNCKPESKRCGAGIIARDERRNDGVRTSNDVDMRATVHHSYGPPDDVLELKDIDEPVVGDDHVLVRVLDAGGNPADWIIIRGTPYLLRLVFGLRKPRNGVRGTDVAGRIEAVGTKVQQLQAGDEVFGWCDGAFAEYACALANHFVPKPENLTFEQAAAFPVAGFTALQAVRDRGEVRPGQKALINGASGGVGTFAVQIAKSFGAEVTGVCSTRNVDMVRSIGADHVIDYTKEDFTQSEQRYDFILDNVANHSLSDLRRALTPRGTLVPNNGTTGGRWIGPVGRLVMAFVISPFVSQRLRPFVSEGKNEDLVTLKELIEAGKVTPVIDRTYPLSAVPEAIGYVGEGHARGKVVITVEHEDK
jgi:NADPH:quinone reductase-like Zn-dependent oxidoreductase